MMTLVSKVLAKADKSWTDIAGICYLHWCPGCEQMHIINIEKLNRFGSVWQFDGNFESPTFSPSINYPGICHYFIKNGKIEFLPDSKHIYSGKTIDMPDFPQDML